jgi:glyoxylase-like metal-dependent hydrolase (beta-lactamase superfamily II)/CheY-like chemotaxis protein
METQRPDSPTGPIEIAHGVYWVGKRAVGEPIDCNPYLIVDGDEAVLVDPGSILDFESVRENVASIVPLDRISLIVAHHQDPDLCASIPLFLSAGVSAPIALHWRTSVLVRYYGIEAPLYLVNENGWEWSFRSGRSLRFLPAPYCHFPGSVMTYDKTTRVLFSGDLFGAFTDAPGLYAGPGYRESMRAFHEHYMPSREILARVMYSVLALDVAVIAPQHGRVIRDGVRDCVEDLRDLECGSFLWGASPRGERDLAHAEVAIPLIESCVARLARLFSEASVRAALRDTPFELDPVELRLASRDLNFGALEAIDRFLSAAAEGGEPLWLTVLEPFLLPRLEEAGLSVPNALVSRSPQLPVPELETHRATEAAGGPTRPPRTDFPVDHLTGFRGERALERLVSSLSPDGPDHPFGIAYFSIVNLRDINRLYGRDAGDDAIRSLSYALRRASSESGAVHLFRLQAPILALVAERCSGDAVHRIVERAKLAAEDSGFVVDRVYVAAGVVYSSQLSAGDEAGRFARVDRSLRARLSRAQVSGQGEICDYLPEDDEALILRKRILLVEPDDTYIRFLRPEIEARGYHLRVLPDGAGADEFKPGEEPDLVIAEATMPRVGGFELRERLLRFAGGRAIPFILVSRRKDEEYIRRAAALGIVHFLKKPFSKAELVGLADNLLRTGDGD